MADLTLLDDDLFEDDEGNQYTAAQLREASAAMARDEAGQGSFGGLAAGEDDLDVTGEQPAPPPVAEAAPEDTSGRELNPMKFGEFFKDNVFSGLGGGYITGKRPMNLYDFASDALAGYSGIDVGARNARIRKSSREDALLESQTAKATAQRQKAGLEVEKLAGEVVTNMMNDLDSDLWAGELKALSKQHGIEIRPGVLSMVERMATLLREAGVSSPAEVLTNPDAYDPNLVNRVRHTMRLLSKSVEESEARQLEADTSRQALGITPGKEQREQDTYAQEQEGTQEALEILKEQANSPDAKVANLARARMATLKRGGDAASRVLQEMSGVGTNAGGRGIEFQSYLKKAEEDLTASLGRPPTESEIVTRALEIRNMARAQGEGQARFARTVADKRAQTAEGLSQLSTMKETIGKSGFGQEGFGGRVQSAGKAFMGKFTDDPALRETNAVNATLTNIARSLGGQKGVLSNLDQQLIEQGAAFRPEKGDTIKGWLVRIAYIERIATRGLAALEKAEREGREPQLIQLTEEEKKGVTGSVGTPAETPSGTAEGGDARRELATQWSARINAEPDPQKKAQLREQAKQELRSR